MESCSSGALAVAGSPKSHLHGMPPLSVHLKIDTEGSDSRCYRMLMPVLVGKYFEAGSKDVETTTLKLVRCVNVSNLHSMGGQPLQNLSHNDAQGPLPCPELSGTQIRNPKS